MRLDIGWVEHSETHQNLTMTFFIFLPIRHWLRLTTYTRFLAFPLTRGRDFFQLCCRLGMIPILSQNMKFVI